MIHIPASRAIQMLRAARRALCGHAFPCGYWNRRRLGTSEADLLRGYPTLRAEDLANAWAYVRANRKEIDNEIRENEEA